MNQIKFEIYQQVLRDVYQNFEDTEEFFKTENSETTLLKQNVVEEVIFLYT